MPAIRVRTATGWQDIAVQGPPGQSLYVGSSAPSPRGDYVLWIDSDEPEVAVDPTRLPHARMTWAGTLTSIVGWQTMPGTWTQDYQTNDATQLDLANGRYYFRYTGLYMLIASVTWAVLNTGWRGVCVRHQPSNAQLGIVYAGAYASGQGALSSPIHLRATAGEYVNVEAYSSSVATNVTNAALSAVLVSA